MNRMEEIEDEIEFLALHYIDLYTEKLVEGGPKFIEQEKKKILKTNILEMLGEGNGEMKYIFFLLKTVALGKLDD